MAATIKCDTLQNTSSATANVTLDGSGNATVGNNLTVTGQTIPSSSFKRNRIINGDMRIDQRATAVTTSGQYTVDRWTVSKSNDATESFAQNTDAPAGFSYSLRDTISVADTSIGAAQYTAIIQKIEGYNIADLGFGTASAKTTTVSFWVKATQTGTYSCVLQGGTPSRQAFKAFSVSASNTWEYKTLTFVGDTDTGTTWNSTNGSGLVVAIYGALGSSFINGTDGVWAASSTNNYGPSGMANALSANGNIFAFTGVQLEVGSAATPYERQIYSDQLAQCQRYYYRFSPGAGGGASFGVGMGAGITTNIGNISMPFPVPMRTAPTGITVNGTFTLNNSGINPTITIDTNVTSNTALGAILTSTGNFVQYRAYYLLSSSSASNYIELTGTEL
jgi:hypothetical protein